MDSSSFAHLLHARPDGPNRWQAHCPGHLDTFPSLTIDEGREGAVIVKCFGGCTRKQILRVLGLAPLDLLPGPAPSTEQAEFVRASLKTRASVERWWREERRKRWDCVRMWEQAVEGLAGEVARAPGNDATAKLLCEARLQLSAAERKAQDIMHPLKAYQWTIRSGKKQGSR